jgi:phospholipid/cholesterol/gamma-HCH transport system substrate-binding protein
VAESTTEQGTTEQGSAYARAATITALVLVALALGFLLLSGDGSHRYTLLFLNGGQLVEGNEVKIGGTPVGSVKELKLSEDGQAEVVIEVDRELNEGTRATIRAVGLVGVANHYVSLEPGPNDAPVMEDKSVLTQTDTSTPVDLDQVFNAFDKPTRRGLGKFIRGQGHIFEGKGAEANETYKYLEPALSQGNVVLRELNRDSQMLERFLVSGSKVFTALADREDDLSASLGNARTAFDAINSETAAFAHDLELLPPTFRRSNTTFRNLRTALDDVDQLVEVAKPATKDLAPFLRDVRPVVKKARPFFADLGQAVRKPGDANDLGELTASLPTVDEKAGPGFRRARRAVADFEPTLSFARAYSPEMLNALSKLSQITSRYDDSGHYVTVRPSGNNLFDYNSGSGLLEPLAASDQYDPFGPPSFFGRCPGGASQAAADSSSPFVGPAWPGSGLTPSDCDPAALPPGP